MSSLKYKGTHTYPHTHVHARTQTLAHRLQTEQYFSTHLRCLRNYPTSTWNVTSLRRRTSVQCITWFSISVYISTFIVFKYLILKVFLFYIFTKSVNLVSSLFFICNYNSTTTIISSVSSEPMAPLMRVKMRVLYIITVRAAITWF